MGRITSIVIVVLVIVVFALSMFYNVKTSQAVERGSDIRIMKKLNEVIKNQQKIMEQLDEVMKELQIVKIRSTR